MTSGQPSPGVTWWRGHEMVDSTYERTYSEAVQNSLKWVSCIALSMCQCVTVDNNNMLPGWARWGGQSWARC